MRPKVLYCEKCKCREPPLHSTVYPCRFCSGSVGKELACQCRRHRSRGFDLWARKIPWRRKWQPTPVFLPGKSHGQKSLVGYSPWDRKGLTRLSDSHTNDTMLHCRRGALAGDPGVTSPRLDSLSCLLLGTWYSVGLTSCITSARPPQPPSPGCFLSSGAILSGDTSWIH